MKLSNFPFNTTSKLRVFSNLMSKAVEDAKQQLNLTNQESLSIPQDSQAEDSLNYWEKGRKNNINYGRYLNTKKAGIPIPFWIGLDITKSSVRFIIWFDKQNYQLYPTLKDVLEKISEGKPSLPEAWKMLDTTSFDQFCQTSNSQILSTFIIDVLQRL